MATNTVNPSSDKDKIVIIQPTFNPIKVVPTTTQVSITEDNTKVIVNVIDSTSRNSITQQSQYVVQILPQTTNTVVPFETTDVVNVISFGPQGAVGPQGIQGPSGSVDTSSLVNTASFNAYTGSSNSKFNGKLNVVANTVSSDYFVVFSNGSGTGTTIYSDPSDALRYNPGTGTLTSTILTLRDIITITPQHPLKVGVYNPGTFAVSASTPPKPYFWDGSNWNSLY